MVLYTYINNNWFIKVSEMPGAAGYHIPEHKMEQKEKEIGEDREKEWGKLCLGVGIQYLGVGVRDSPRDPGREYIW